MATMTTHITPHRRCMLMRACTFVIIVFAIRCNIEYLCQSSNHEDEKQYTFTTTTALLWNGIYIIIKIHNYQPPLIVPFSSWYLQSLSSLFPLYVHHLSIVGWHSCLYDFHALFFSIPLATRRLSHRMQSCG